MTDKYPTLTVRVPKGYRDRIDAHWPTTGAVSRSEWIRGLIDRGLEKNQGAGDE